MSALQIRFVITITTKEKNQIISSLLIELMQL